jgi:hypothetical protein
MRFGVYFENATKKSLVRCDVCQKIPCVGCDKVKIEIEEPLSRKNHIDGDQQLLLFPAKLRLSAHISRVEEEQMGVELANTTHYRAENDLMNEGPMLGSFGLQKGGGIHSFSSIE